VRGTNEEGEKKKELDEVQLTISRRINWRPLNEYTTSTIGQEKRTRPPGIQEPQVHNDEPRSNENGDELHRDYDDCD